MISSNVAKSYTPVKLAAPSQSLSSGMNVISFAKKNEHIIKAMLKYHHLDYA